MAVLKIERLGGLAGFGLPGSRLKSSGEQALSALSAADQASVNALFHGGGSRGRDAERDAFRYRITRIEGERQQTVEVPESAVPEALVACVTDRIQ